jgi:hypothetical protein
VTADTMATECYRFYQIVSQLMEQAVPEKAKYCEFFSSFCSKLYYEPRNILYI